MDTVIRSILFDLGNVLVPFEIQRGYAALSADSGLSQEEVAIRIRDSGLYPAFESGEIEPVDFHQRFCQLLGLQAQAPAFREIWNSIFLPHTATSEELILQLRNQYRLVLLSNTNALHFGWLQERYPILQHFDAYTLSYQVGAMKPDPRIYAAAVENAKCKAEECFFTDDVPAYVEGARAFGIDAEVFTNEENLKAQLRSRGLIA
ncbi:HAD family hydrolase [Bryobacter aggregatus]|uniref:HAD family hydrolase n=1 Tax=Bryobacter aggregatus TaxID=360054 RepID=UPI00068B7FE1|nr:HAD family phosphatase [Bryobacter aggregatus]